MDIFCALKQTL